MNFKILISSLNINKLYKFLSIIYLFIILIGCLTLKIIQNNYKPNSQFMIAFDAGSKHTTGHLYEVILEKNDYGIIPINSLHKCIFNNGIDKAKSVFSEDWKLNWDKNYENNKAKNIKNNDLHQIITAKHFDQFDTKPIIENEKNDILTIDEAVDQIGNCFNKMLLKLYEINLKSPKNFNQKIITYFAATSGLRMLKFEDNFKKTLQTDLILMSISNKLEKNFYLMSKNWPSINDKFSLKIGIISGKEEAIANWISSSYLVEKMFSVSSLFIKPKYYDTMNLFDRGTAFEYFKTEQTHKKVTDSIRKTGVLSLEDLSFQISFSLFGTEKYLEEVNEKYKEDINEIKILNENYQIYGHSLLCFGLDKVWQRALYLLILKNPNQHHLKHPCLNSDISFNRTLNDFKNDLCLNTLNNINDSEKNYNFQGSYDSLECNYLIDDLIDKEECEKNFYFCPSLSMLAPPRNLTFIATSKIYEITRVFGKNLNSLTHDDYLIKLNNWCNQELTLVFKREYMIFKFAIQYCFGLHYTESMFVKIFQIAKEDFENIHFINKLNNETIEWSLGYLISNIESKVKSSKIISCIILSKYLIIFLTLSPFFVFISFKQEIKSAFEKFKLNHLTK